MEQVEQETNHVITSTMINNIIAALDSVAKQEGLSLRGSEVIIRAVIHPLTSLQQINLTPPEEVAEAEGKPNE
jgi:hypothetical protein